MSMPTEVPNDQPQPVAGRQDVTEELIALLRRRRARGIATYGRSLETFNGRDSARDLVEELLDATQYALQGALERAALLARIAELAAEVARLREHVNGEKR